MTADNQPRGRLPQADAQVHGRVATTLLAAGHDAGLANADPHLTGSLPHDASLAGDPTTLVADRDYALVADRDAMLNAPALRSPDPHGARIRTYRRAAYLLRGRTPPERAVGLQLARLAAGEPAFPTPDQWAVQWRRGPAVTNLLTLTGHTDRVTAGATAIVDDHPIIATGSPDADHATVRLWDATTRHHVATLPTLGTVIMSVAGGKAVHAQFAIAAGRDVIVLRGHGWHGSHADLALGPTGDRA